MRISSSEPGFVVSGAAHLILLLATLVAFSRTAKFEDVQESVPVQVITSQQFNKIAKGEKTAKTVLPKPARRVDKIAETRRARPRPPVHVAKRDAATPPPPRRIAVPAHEKPPTPPQKSAQAPPPRPTDNPAPAPPSPPARPEPKLTPQRAEKAADAPLPPQRPKFQTVAKKEQPAPMPPERPKFQDVAKALERNKLDALVKTADAQPARPRDSRRDAKERLDPAEISRLLSHDDPQQRAATGRSLTKMASLGAERDNAPRMSPSMWGALDGILQDQYKKCWSYLGLNVENSYVPKISVVYNADGSLAAMPSLINPPSDPNMRSLAESALRAVRECNPLRIPTQFAPYFNQWKARILRFDPAEMSG